MSDNTSIEEASIMNNHNKPAIPLIVGLGQWEGIEPEIWVPHACGKVLTEAIMECPLFHSLPFDDKVKRHILSYCDLVETAQTVGAARIVTQDECQGGKGGAVLQEILDSMEVERIASAIEEGGGGKMYQDYLQSIESKRAKYSSLIVTIKFLATSMFWEGMGLERDCPPYDAIQFFAKCRDAYGLNTVLLGRNRRDFDTTPESAVLDQISDDLDGEGCDWAEGKMMAEDDAERDLWETYEATLTPYGRAILGDIQYDHSRQPWNDSFKLFSDERGEAMVLDRNEVRKGCVALCGIYEDGRSVACLANYQQVLNVADVVYNLAHANERLEAYGETPDMDPVQNVILANVDRSATPAVRVRQAIENLLAYVASHTEFDWYRIQWPETNDELPADMDPNSVDALFDSTQILDLTWMVQNGDLQDVYAILDESDCDKFCEGLKELAKEGE